MTTLYDIYFFNSIIFYLFIFILENDVTTALPGAVRDYVLESGGHTVINKILLANNGKTGVLLLTSNTITLYLIEIKKKRRKVIVVKVFNY